MQNLNKKNRLKQQDGSIMVTALMIMAILSIIGLYANNVATTELQITTNVQANQMAFYDADAGAQHTLAIILQQLNNGTNIGSIDLTDNVYQAPSGFNFVVTQDATWSGSGPHQFVSTGTGPRNSTHSIEVTFNNTLGVHPAFDVGILSDGDIVINGAPDMIGSMHANGDVIQNGAGTINGMVSAGGNISIDSIDPDGKPVPQEENAELREVPKITNADFDAWRTLAETTPNIYVNGSHTVHHSDTGDLNGKIIFVDGDLTIQGGGDSIVNATIIATGDVTFRGQSETQSLGGPVEVAVIAGGNITFNGSGDSWGVFWCNGNFRRNGAANVNGAIVAGNAIEDLDITFNGSFSFEHSSNINNNFIPKKTYVKIASWADQGMLP